MIEASWCEQHDLFYWESLNSQPVALSETDPISLPTDSRLIYIAWEQIFLTTWVIDLYKAQMFSFSAETLSEWHKLLLIKILTIHCKWVFSVNMVWAGANGACWGILGNRGRSESTFEESMLGQKERNTWRSILTVNIWPNTNSLSFKSRVCTFIKSQDIHDQMIECTVCQRPLFWKCMHQLDPGKRHSLLI